MPAALASILASIGVWFLEYFPSLIAQFFLALGLSVVTFKGFELVLPVLLNNVLTSWAGLPPHVYQFAEISGITTGISMLLGVEVSRLEMKLLFASIKFAKKGSSAAFANI
jgi:hypothetical protein